MAFEDDEPFFRDRREGGRALVPRLAAYRGRADAVVLGLPRGGVVPAAEIADALGLPLDVVIVRKLGAPGYPELAIGAVAEGGEVYVDPDTAAHTGASRAYVAAEVARKRAEIEGRQQRFRAGASLALPARATAILVDDGVATGSTVIAAIHAVRRQHPSRVVLAVPVAPPDTARLLRTLVDELVVLATPAAFRAVGQFYGDFAQVSDEDVAALLSAGRTRRDFRPPAAGRG